jgi:hypothetical protein
VRVVNKVATPTEEPKTETEALAKETCTVSVTVTGTRGEMVWLSVVNTVTVVTLLAAHKPEESALTSVNNARQMRKKADCIFATRQLMNEGSEMMERVLLGLG